MANTWNQSGTTWNTGRWGTTDAITSGWGADAWNTGGSWGKATDELVVLTGLSLTASVGNIEAFALQGWGRDTWNDGPWGESDNPVVSLTGFVLTSSLVSPTICSEIISGWGQDCWGV